nr:heavy metal-responsive transcriptional regulator [Chloroflexota bacterium]
MRIGELAQLAGVNPRTLRYYERIGLLTPSSRTEAGYRVYSPGDADRLAFIRRAQSVGLSLAEIADVIALRDTGTVPCRHVRALAEAKVSEIDVRVAELQQLR